MNTPEPAQPDLDPALENLMSQVDDALLAGDPTDEFEREITERFGESPSHIVATLKALHSARATSLSSCSSGPNANAAALERTLSTTDETTWVRATSGLAKTLFGRFEILERLGSGGSGTVFRARDSSLARLVALKVARAEALFSSEAKQRFVREAQSLAALRHPNIIPIYEFGESGGLPYIVEELCHGPNLAVWLSQSAKAHQKAPIRTAVQWTLLLAEAVAHAHRSGIVHRDLKPSNVLLAPPTHQSSDPCVDDLAAESFTPRVSDFGIAKLFDSEEGVTASQAVLGTAAYMAPEQAEGRSSEVGPPADVYSLGVILYELLTGRRPIEGRSDVDTLRRVLTDEPLPLTQVRRDVPGDLEAICLKCLEKNSANRYPSAAELAEDLGHFLKGEPVCARRLHSVTRVIRRLRRQSSPAGLVLSAFAALAILAGIVVIIIRTRDGEIIVWQPRTAGEPRPVAALRGAYPEDIHQASLLLDRREVDVLARQATANQARQLLAKYIPQQGEEDLRGFEWRYLWKITAPRSYAPMFRAVRTISAHDGTAYFVCFSPDGKSVATASADTKARVWDVETGQLRFTLAGHTNEVNCVAFSPDGKLLATAGDDGTVRLWDGATGKPHDILWKHTEEVVGVAFNPVNGLLACAARDGVLTTWDCAARRQLEKLIAAPGGRVDDLAFSRDGQLLAMACGNSMVRLWQFSTPPRPLALLNVSGRALAVSFSHDGPFLAVGHTNGARIYRIDNSETLSQMHLDDHFQSHFVRAVGFTKDDSSLLTAGDKFASKLVDLTTGETWDPFGTGASFWCAAFSPDGKLVATSDGTGELVLWDCSARQSFHRTQLDVPPGSPAARLAISANGSRIVVAADASGAKDGADGELAVWDISRSQAKRLRTLASAGTRRFHDVALSPDGNAIAYGEHRAEKGRDRICVVDAKTGNPKFQLDAGAVDCLFFSPGGSTLVSQERQGSPAEVRLQIRDAQTAALVRTIPLRSNAALFAFSPSKNLFASVGKNHDAQIDLYRLPDPKRMATISGFGETIHSLAFSKDEQSVIGQGTGGYVAALSCETGAIVRQFTVAGVVSVPGYAMASSRDGRTLALGSKAGIVLAEMESGHVLCTLPFPTEMKEVTTIAFAADGQTVVAATVTAGGRCGVYLWQASESSFVPPASPGV
ncbi:MAG TPA: protein kinase [Planctomycetaceae bacterium]|jgi:WD40 repeat protein/serine/threonine protein kinase|nr:protein kinase [Planctomycetaceae bacterium]